MNRFSAHGKLLLTGEYLVLKGALALGLPTKLGQSMTVETTNERQCKERSDETIHWYAYQPNGLWFSVCLDASTLEVVETDDPSKTEQLVKILQAVRELHPQAIQPGLCFETRLDFDPAWGLGSSSTLISNLAQWAEINPYELLRNTMGGSGYDIACATASSAIFYRLDKDQPLIQPVEFNPPFVDHLYFVYQGKKQHSSNEVKAFNQHWEEADLTTELQTISELSRALPSVTYFEDFCTLLQVHENLLSHCLGREPVQGQFSDFNGVLKSLGAWGGDFLLAATEMPSEEVTNYFRNKGLTTIFKYHDLIL